MASAEEYRAFALKACTEYIGEYWASEEHFSFAPMTGGVTNLLFRCETTAINCAGPNICLLRIFESGLGDEGGHMMHNITYTILAERGFGPQLYGAFKEGRLEEFLNGRTLEVGDMSHPATSTRIAYATALLHNKDLPLKKTTTWLFDTMERMCKEGWQRTAGDRPIVDDILKFDVHKELEWLRVYLMSTPRELVVCHNDLNEGNFIDVNGKLRVIDYDYVRYNFREFDIANHFCEWAINNNCATDYFSIDFTTYPNKEQRLLFLKTYLESRKQEADIKHAESLDRSVQRFRLACHLFWCFWSMMNRHSKIEWPYYRYALERLKLYEEHKAILLREEERDKQQEKA